MIVQAIILGCLLAASLSSAVEDVTPTSQEELLRNERSTGYFSDDYDVEFRATLEELAKKVRSTRTPYCKIIVLDCANGGHVEGTTALPFIPQGQKLLASHIPVRTIVPRVGVVANPEVTKVSSQQIIRPSGPLDIVSTRKLLPEIVQSTNGLPSPRRISTAYLGSNTPSNTPRPVYIPRFQPFRNKPSVIYKNKRLFPNIPSAIYETKRVFPNRPSVIKDTKRVFPHLPSVFKDTKRVFPNIPSPIGKTKTGFSPSIRTPPFVVPPNYCSKDLSIFKTFPAGLWGFPTKPMVHNIIEIHCTDLPRVNFCGQKLCT